MRRASIVSVVGARPQFIKSAPLSAALAADGAIDEISVHTGQHFDDNMSEIFFREFGMRPPDRVLGVHGGSHAEMTGRMLTAIEAVLDDVRPAAALVYGDTNSTLAGALAAAKLAVPVIHVEAGLRSFNRKMPEEINRVVADHLSALLFCPTIQSVKNLAAEGIAENVHHVGDIMYDAALRMLPIAAARSDILGRLRLKPRDYAVATIHRAENTEATALRGIFDYLAERARRRPVVLPLHPRTRQAAAAHGVALARPGLVVVEPLGYLDFSCLLHHAAEVLTDSGGIQKEAYFHRVPCVTLRSETEWVETVEHGWNRLWNGADYRPRSDIADYGGGDAAATMVAAIKDFLS
jgi:UDP-GlcNAc3NAcA epimerase